MSNVTEILKQIESGDPAAAERLLLVYEELRKLAAAKVRTIHLGTVFWTVRSNSSDPRAQQRRFNHRRAYDGYKLESKNVSGGLLGNPKGTSMDRAKGKLCKQKPTV